MFRRLSISLLLVLSLLSASNALAASDTTVIIPIIGRFNGIAPSVWRTDVFIGTRTGAPALTMTFYPAGGGEPIVRDVTLGPGAALDFPDIMLNTFGMSSGSGMLIFRTTPFAGGLEARARIYNAGSAAGEFGQSAPGRGLSTLTREAYMWGLSGIDGNRVNIGVANPNDTATTFAISITDRNNTLLFRQDLIPIAAYQVIQYNDIFATFGIAPSDGIQVNIFTLGPKIYGYASQVRNDTGDAIFMSGANPNK